MADEAGLLGQHATWLVAMRVLVASATFKPLGDVSLVALPRAKMQGQGPVKPCGWQTAVSAVADQRTFRKAIVGFEVDRSGRILLVE